MKKGLPSTHRPLPAMVVHKDRVADQDVSEGCDGHGHQPVPEDKDVDEGGVDEAAGGGDELAPGGLGEQGVVQGGDHVDQAVQGNQVVNSVLLLLQNAHPSPKVDNECDYCD